MDKHSNRRQSRDWAGYAIWDATTSFWDIQD